MAIHLRQIFTMRHLALRIYLLHTSFEEYLPEPEGKNSLDSVLFYCFRAIHPFTADFEIYLKLTVLLRV